MRSFRILGGFAAAMLASAAAPAQTPNRDQAWDALVAEAKSHGGVETRLDRSASYVFQRPDGIYVTLTRALKGGKRDVCLVAKDENATLCVDWDSGKTTWGRRRDAASPWTLREAASIEEVAAAAPGPLDGLSSILGSMFSRSGGRRGPSQGGYWRVQNGQEVWVNRN